MSVALADVCKGNPNTLGTARVAAFDPAVVPRVGTAQFDPLPLRDHEVVLTFDDGPSSASTAEVLNALAAQCVKANFFVVGQNARANPELVRREFSDGHTIGTHTKTHADLAKLPLIDAEKEIQGGIDDANSALLLIGTAAPFFRAPYLSTTARLNNYLAAAGLMLWSIDIDPEDWRPLTPDDVVSRVMAQLAEKKSGIILMHDVQPHTAAAIPKLLHELRSNGYSIVHALYGSAKEATARP